MNKLSIITALLGIVLLASCGNLEREIEIDLPEYQSQYIVECYLEPGQPFTLLLSKSVPYFEPFPTDPLAFVENILVDSAEVTISHNGMTYKLDNSLIINPFTSKIFNYGSSSLVPNDLYSDFQLHITTPDGKTITATTQLLPVVPIDSVVIEFDETRDTLARALTYLTDDPNSANFFRRMIHHHSLDSIPDQDFTADDQFVDNTKIVFGTGYDFKEGDTVFNTIFHIDRAYYDFWQSTFNAVNANGNPFGQPSGIISNLQGDAGAVGIFTGLNYDRVMTIVEK